MINQESFSESSDPLRRYSRKMSYTREARRERKRREEADCNGRPDVAFAWPHVAFAWPLLYL